MAKHSKKEDLTLPEESLAQQDSGSSLNTVLSGDEAERIEAADDESGEVAGGTALKRREERHRPESIEEENIGLFHVSGIDDEEVGRELNISGTEELDEDDNGNPIDPATAAER